MNKKPWPYEEAQGIIDFFGKDLPEVINLETGFGPSGPPHIGTFGEIARTMFVQLALEDLGYSTKIIAFSDDMDGLRKVPMGFPAALNKDLGKPVSQIPDPFGCHDSYSMHMNNLLVEMVELAGAKVEFKYSSEEYKKGNFNEEIKLVLKNYQKANDIVTHNYSSEVQKTWFPFFIICENCGNIYTTRILDIDPAKAEIKYACDQQFDSSAGCGNISTRSALNGSGKLPWKIDWAARWHAFNIRYEIYGKDLITSAEVSDKICTDIFNWQPPKHMFYELFLDEDGTKISKSKGDAINPTTWLKYGNLESLYYLFFNKPRSAKRVSINRLPSYLLEISKIEQEYYRQKTAGEIDDTEKNTYYFITRFNPPQQQPVRIDFSLLLNLIAALGTQDKTIIRKYAEQAVESSEKTGDNIENEIIDRELDKAFAFYKEVHAAGEKSLDYAAVEKKELKSLEDLMNYLMLAERTAEEIHNMIYAISKNNDIQPGAFFKLLYLILTKQERGPRLGNFITILGQDYISNILLRAIIKIERTIEIEGLKSWFKEILDKMVLKDDKKETAAAKTSMDEKEAAELQAKRTVPTKKLFKDDPYRKEFEAEITMVKGTKVSLNQTCFYPAGGGQVGDSGTINGLPVIGTQYGDGDIAHLLQDEPALKSGDKVKCRIDWDKRYKIMRLHSASYIMEYFLFKIFGELEGAGSSVSEKHDKSTYKHQGRLPDAKLKEVEKSVNQFLSRNLEIKIEHNPKYPELGTWTCGEISKPLSGTHPKNTQEIGQVQLKRKNGGSGKEVVVTSFLTAG
ncbi:MAG: lysine--tRNA ligase [Candidatus Aminicenantes bacterium]|nr:lysine--tRNA ligase [Candidatus Aminicenantes bacterium]